MLALFPGKKKELVIRVLMVSDSTGARGARSSCTIARLRPNTVEQGRIGVWGNTGGGDGNDTGGDTVVVLAGVGSVVVGDKHELVETGGQSGAQQRTNPWK